MRLVNSRDASDSVTMPRNRAFRTRAGEAGRPNGRDTSAYL
jgi:hypothetical protein